MEQPPAFRPAGPAPAWLAAAAVLAESGELADTTAGWWSYREYLGVLWKKEPMRREKKFTALTRNWAVGSTAFRAELLDRLGGSPGTVFAPRLGPSRGARRSCRAVGGPAAGPGARLRHHAGPAAEEEVSREKTAARRGDEAHDVGGGPLARAAPADGRAQQRGDAGAPVSTERCARPTGPQGDFIQIPSMTPWTGSRPVRHRHAGPGQPNPAERAKAAPRLALRQAQGLRQAKRVEGLPGPFGSAK